MAVWPFNRKKTEDSTLPEEVQNYYQAEKRERAGVAGLLAVGTLLVTVLIAVGLFFGGRWIYRTVVDNNDDKNTNTTAENNGEQQPVSPTTDNQDKKADTPAPTTPSANPTPNPTPATTPQPTTPTAAAQTPTTTPKTGSDDLPNTGPGNITAILIGTVVLASALHYVTLGRRQTS